MKDKLSETQVMQARTSGGEQAPSRAHGHEEQSSVFYNPAPDASSPAVPSAFRLFTATS
ncbi:MULTISPECIES: hypothetical protein [unclassified Bradyrhizobium]|uniref:hypothetical protein n=1 Tax=unclassified Bradyrhizobium TaxID=2631580 RepID=UPI002916408D|nr:MULTISPECIES: hypothetical protein [unclassified Bradyrhizobium]